MLIIEDGSMQDGANSYATIEDANEWHKLRMSSQEVWGDDEQYNVKKEAALIRAADYLNGLHWIGRRTAQGRIMAWPRAGVVDSDGFVISDSTIPTSVICAQCYLAGVIFEGKTDRQPQPILERGGRVASESMSGLNTTYFEDAASRIVYTVLLDMLRGLATGLDGIKNKTTICRVSLG